MALLNAKLIYCVFWVVRFHSVTHAQFPTACVQNVTVYDKSSNPVTAQEISPVCCPNNCSAGEGRGECTKISKPKYTLDLIRAEKDLLHVCSRSDVRFLWPSGFNTTHSCMCKNNWAGSDCSKCKFGYTLSKGTNGTKICAKSAGRIKRKSTLRLTDSEWKTYTDTLLKASVTPSSYSVFMGTMANRETWRFVPVTIYDYFVWVHYFASKDNNNETPTCDFAHESSGFLTWHRWYLLVVEGMLREIDSKFFIPYWDWTNESSASDLYSEPHLGTAPTWDDIKDRYLNTTGSERCAIDDPEMNVKDGPFVNWKTMCTNMGKDATNGFLCNPNNETQRRPLQRCRGCCQVDDCCLNDGVIATGRQISILPKLAHVNYALEASIFDSSNWTTQTTKASFRNRLEGFVQPVPPYVANHRQHYIHNQVHIYVGGTEVPLSPNSPYFWMHHGMIDYIFEQWINNHLASGYRPTPAEADLKPLAHPGHNPEEHIVPFFPSVTHIEVFKSASEFGYEYEPPTSGAREDNSTSPPGGFSFTPSLDGSTKPVTPTNSSAKMNQPVKLTVCALFSLVAFNLAK